MKKSRIKIMALAFSATFAGTALAAVSADEAKQLEGPVLTRFGAEKAGNKAGTIPAYTGEGVNAPASYDPNDPGQRPNPFNEKPLFSITAQNMAQYGDKLSEGQKALFKTFPNYRMDIYPTHRTGTYPKYVLDNTAKNATACKALNNGLTLEGCYGGVAFPIPKTGAEVMWNHLTAFEAKGGLRSRMRHFLVHQDGNVTFWQATDLIQKWPFYDPDNTKPIAGSSIFWNVRQDYLAPARNIGQNFIVKDALDNLNVGRRAWQYIPGQRRVKLAPDLSYDTPSPSGGGIMTVDDGKGFQGAMDRFDWKLLGKQEKYILYNNFDLQNYKVCPNEKQTTPKNFLNPDCARWELHRVWAVEGTLKPQFRHVYHRRILYWDEDTYSAGMTENYDASNVLFRTIFQVSVPYWQSEGGGEYNESNIVIDLISGSWFFCGAMGAKGDGAWVTKPADDYFFSPESLAGKGVR